MTSGRAGKGMGVKGGNRSAGAGGDGIERDIAEEAHGLNRLQGNDQEKRHHQRSAMAEATDRTEGVVESFVRMDPKARAAADATRQQRSDKR